MASSKRSVYVALTADLIIAITKFIAAIVTHSSAMVSEGVHSLIDSVNEILLLVGIKKSKKPADKKRPFGYGKELYFWSFIVSMLLFLMGGIFSFYTGYNHLKNPAELENLSCNYIVLGVAFVFNSLSVIPPLQALNRESDGKSLWIALKHSKDPSTFMVFLEDIAGLVGVVVAFLGIWLGHIFNNIYFDGIATLIIGLILTAISIVLIIENKSLLLGETEDKKTLKEIVQMTEEDESIVKVIRHFSMHMAPEEVVLQLIAVFKDGLSTKEITQAITRIEKKIHQRFPRIKQIFIEPGTMKKRAVR